LSGIAGNSFIGTLKNETYTVNNNLKAVSASERALFIEVKMTVPAVGL
jgi:hypothetical protein